MREDEIGMSDDHSQPPPPLDEAALEELLEMAAAAREVVCTRPFTFSREQVARLVEALGKEPCVAWQTAGSYFPDARWERFAVDAADFTAAGFGEASGFFDARFGHGAQFSGACFGLPVDGTGDVRQRARGTGFNVVGKNYAGDYVPDFVAAAHLVGCHFGDHAQFDDTVWLGDAQLSYAAFGRGAQFDRLTQHGHLRLRGATFGAGSYFGVRDGGGVDDVYRYIDFTRAAIDDGAQIKIDDASIDVTFAEAAIGSWVRITCAKSENWRDRRSVSMASAYLGHGVQFSADGGDIDLTKARGAGLRVAGAVRVTSLRGANLSELALDRVDLASCHWEGAAIDKLRLGGGTLFARARVLPFGRSPSRDVLREDDWSIAGETFTRTPGESMFEFGSEFVAMSEVEDRYRLIRTALEQGGNGAAGNDFYYAEMQLRRLGRRWSSDRFVAPSVHGFVLQMYWLTSGYGLRAWRAIAALLAVLVVAAALYTRADMAVVGPADATTPRTSPAGMAQRAERPVTFGEGLIVAGQQGLSVRTRPGIVLNTSGEAIGLLLRILVPLLLAMAALAIRNRISRSHPWR